MVHKQRTNRTREFRQFENEENIYHDTSGVEGKDEEGVATHSRKWEGKQSIEMDGLDDPLFANEVNSIITTIIMTLNVVNCTTAEV